MVLLGMIQQRNFFRAWRNRNYGKYFGSRNVELKNAIVQAFKEDFKILLVTDSGSEGLNLQFCNTIINYDLPWNPQKLNKESDDVIDTARRVMLWYSICLIDKILLIKDL